MNGVQINVFTHVDSWCKFSSNLSLFSSAQTPRVLLLGSRLSLQFLYSIKAAGLERGGDGESSRRVWDCWAVSYTMQWPTVVSWVHRLVTVGFVAWANSKGWKPHALIISLLVWNYIGGFCEEVGQGWIFQQRMMEEASRMKSQFLGLFWSNSSKTQQEQLKPTRVRVHQSNTTYPL